MKTINTVLGQLDIKHLGIVLMHEHLHVDISFMASAGKINSKSFNVTKNIAKSINQDYDQILHDKVKIKNLGALKRDPTRSKDNLVLDNNKFIIDELLRYHQFGGKTIVDVTNISMGRDINSLKTISAKTGINVIASTGWYLEPTYPAYIQQKTIHELAEIMISEIKDGIEKTDIKAGLIGECGCSADPYTELEKKVILAACLAQKETNVPMTIHPALIDVKKRNGFVKCGMDYIALLKQEKVNLNKFYLSHADRTCFDLDYHKSLLDQGIYLSYDCFGKSDFFDNAFPGAGGLSDYPRMKALVKLCELGYEKQLLISQDVCFKTGLRKFGGMGYSHFLENIIPNLKTLGLKDSSLKNLLINNPKKLFQIK